MKNKLNLLLVLFCLQIPLSAQAGFHPRQARTEDFEGILRTYQTYSQEDRKRLVTFPAEVEEQVLRADLESGKLFIYVNERNTETSIETSGDSSNKTTEKSGKIAGLLKLFIIPGPDVQKILKDELRCIGDKKELILSEEFNSSLMHSPDDYIRSISAPSLQPKEDYFTLSENQQLFIYYGGAYTSPSERGKGIQTELLTKALEVLKPDVERELEKFNVPKQILIAYGQVDANINNKGMIQTFAKFAQNLNQDLSNSILHLGYRTYKPSLIYNTVKKELEVTYPDSGMGMGMGMGNLLILTLRGRQS